MDDTIKSDRLTDKLDETYILQEVTMDVILDDLHINSVERSITKSIILGIERDAAAAIKEHIVVSLPNVGNVLKDATQVKIKEHWQEIQEAKATLTKEKYKEFIKTLRKKIKDELAEQYRIRRTLEKFKRSHRKRYDEVCKIYGLAYGNLYLQSILWMTDIEFNPDVQEQYDRLNGVWED